jgi:hypothetical protein
MRRSVLCEQWRTEDDGRVYLGKECIGGFRGLGRGPARARSELAALAPMMAILLRRLRAVDDGCPLCCRLCGHVDSCVFASMHDALDAIEAMPTEGT